MTTRAHPPYLSANDRRDSASRDWLRPVQQTSRVQWLAAIFLYLYLLLYVSGLLL